MFRARAVSLLPFVRSFSLASSSYSSVNERKKNQCSYLFVHLDVEAVRHLVILLTQYIKG